MTNKLIIPYRAADDLEPEIIAMAIPPFSAPGVRCPSIVRIRRVGAVFFVEQMQYQRAADNSLKENWTGVAIAKDKGAREEAFGWMHKLNDELIQLSVASPRR